MRRAWGHCSPVRSARFAMPTGMTPMHLDDESMQRLMHDELAPPARAAALEHLEACHACRARLDGEASAEEQIFAMLQAIDTPAPLRVLELDSASHASRRWLTR